QHPPDPEGRGAPVRQAARRAGGRFAMTRRVAVIGAGSWGTALANLLAKKGVPTILWSYEPEVAEEIRRNHRNPTYLVEADLDRRLRATSSLQEAVEGAD